MFTHAQQDKLNNLPTLHTAIVDGIQCYWLKVKLAEGHYVWVSTLAQECTQAELDGLTYQGG
jgi:hypothetical protein